MSAFALGSPSVPPGTVLDYAQVTNSVTISATSAAAANTIVTGNGFTADGATPVWVEFFCPSVSIALHASGNMIIFHLYLDGADTTLQFNQLAGPAAASVIYTAYGRVKLTPASGTRTYGIRAYRSNANCTINLNATTYPPAYIQVSKA